MCCRACYRPLAAESRGARQHRDRSRRSLASREIAGRWSHPLTFNQEPCLDWSVFLAERAAQLRQRNVLQLANTLACDAEILTDVLERLRLSAVETETLKDDFLLPIVEHFD